MLSLLSSLTVGRDLRPDTDSCSIESQRNNDTFSTIGPLTPLHPTSHGRSISISVVPCSDDRRPSIPVEEMTDAFSPELSTPPVTRASKTCTAKPSHTPPLASRKLLQLLPNIALTRSKSQESQLANRIEESATNKWVIGLLLQSALYGEDGRSVYSSLLSVYNKLCAIFQLVNITLHLCSNVSVRTTKQE